MKHIVISVSLRRLILIFILLLQGTVVAQENADLRQGMQRWTLDNATLPDNEKMGLLGWDYLLEHDQFPTYGGLGIYSAITGDRGGFFVGGFELGIRPSLGSFAHLDAGYYIGGGGGGAAPQGGGLMLRPHVSLLFGSLDRYLVGVSVSRVQFPNGAIESNQLAFQYEYRFERWFDSGWHTDQRLFTLSEDSGGRFGSRQFGLNYTRYVNQTGHAGRSGRLIRRMDIIGIRARNRLGKSLWWLEFDTGGAFAGGVDGYAQVLFGISRQLTLSPSLLMHIGLQPGASGGGDVDTGGGLLLRPFTGLNWRFSPHMSWLLDAGYISALDGEFSAWAVNTSLMMNFQAFEPESGNGIRYNRARWQAYSIRAGVQRYLLVGDEGRKSDRFTDVDVDLVALKLEHMFTQYWFLTGQALGAYAGGAGGYAVGLLGLGGWTPALGAVNLKAGFELTGGAAGGGGLDVGGGFLLQPMLNLAADISEGLALYAGYGRVIAPAGGLNASLAEVGLQLRLSAPRAMQ